MAALPAVPSFAGPDCRPATATLEALTGVRLHLSIPSPLNPACNPLLLLARDLEAEPLAEAAESVSIGQKASHSRSLAPLLVIIYLIA